MPTEFDDFSWNAKWDKISWKKGEKYKNAYILRRAMEKAWFYTISSEWRHYQTDIGRSTLNHLETEELSERWIIF
jgi:D-alanyl-D-alanine dipeptidase